MRLFFFDVDGTLYDNNNKRIPASTIDALKQLKALNDILVVCTGRALYLLHVLDDIIDLFDYLIVLNGQHVVDINHNGIIDNPINKDIVNNMIEDFDRLNILYGLQGTANEVISKLDQEAHDFINTFNLRIPNVDKTFHHQNDVYQMWVYTKKENINYMQQKYPQFDFVNWNLDGYDILPNGCNKRQGAKSLIEYLNFPFEDTYAFGDGDNDAYLFEAVNHKIAMGNASALTKSKATYITDDVSNDGIYNALVALNIIK